jgi:hypothetical protein
MSSNILTGKPNNCADGVLTGSIHLGNSQLGKTANTISPEYTETTVELSKRATPENCANCIGKLCMLKTGEDEVRGERLQATHSNIINHDPREQKEKAYRKLSRQSDEFNLQDLNEAIRDGDLTDLADFHASRGLDPEAIAEMGLPDIDPEAIADQAA